MPNDANPFQPAPGAIPPFLAGRESEMVAIEDAIARFHEGSAPTPLIFTGLRGLGKTVLLHEVHRLAPDSVHLALEVERDASLGVIVREGIERVRAQLQSPARKAAAALADAVRTLPTIGFELPGGVGSIRLEAPEEAEELAPPGSVGFAIDALNDAVASTRKRLVITLDELQAADVADVRSIVAAVHRSVSGKAKILFAAAGLPETNDLLHKLPTYVRSRWDRFNLEFLTRAESAQALRVPLQGAGVSITPDAVDAMVEESGGYPYFLQKYGSAAWGERKGKTIDLAGAARAIERVRPILERQTFRDELDVLSKRERSFCYQLARLGPGAHELAAVTAGLGLKSSQAGSMRSQLIKKGVIFNPMPGMVQFRMPLTERYILKHAAEFDLPLQTPGFRLQ
jgi:hypothetical protein